MKCLRYGHFSMQCKGKERCAKCSGEHQTSGCQAKDYCCVMCEGAHHANNYKQCPEFEKQKNIKNIMGR